jgi:hypothetical protein
MKKILLFIGIITFSAVNAQLVVTKGDNTPINNNDVIGFAVTGSASQFNYKLKNTSNQEIYAKVRCTGLVNTDGTNFQFCLDQCYNYVTVGQNYPFGAGAPLYETIAANGTNFAGYNFKNYNTSNQADYSFRFFQVDINGNPIGTPINFTYRYDTALSVADIEKINTLKGMGINLQNNAVTNEMVFENTQTANMTIYGLSGKAVFNTLLNLGNQNINISNLNNGIYMVLFSNQEGQNANVKMVKR